MLEDIDNQRLAKAWNCIMDDFFDLCIKHSNEKSVEGISVFKFLSKTEVKNKENINCGFQFITKDSMHWNKTLGPYKEEIIKEFDPDKHLLISVHVPTVSDQNETIGNIRLFNKTDKTNEIYLNLK